MSQQTLDFAIVAICTVMLWTGPSFAETTTKVFILAGQSNMDGRGDGSQLTVDDRQRLAAVQDRVLLA